MSDHPTPAPSEAGETAGRCTCGHLKARHGAVCYECPCRAFVAAHNTLYDAMQWEQGEHHWRDGLLFKRMPSGEVRLRHWRQATTGGRWTCEEVALVPAAEWESIVREVAPTGTPAGETETLADAIRAHIRERTDPDCNGDNPQWDGGFKAACSQILAVVDGFVPALPVDGGAGEPKQGFYLRSAPIPDEDAAGMLEASPTLQTTGWEAMLLRRVRALEAQLAAAEQERDLLREAGVEYFAASDALSTKAMRGVSPQAELERISRAEAALFALRATLAPTGEPDATGRQP